MILLFLVIMSAVLTVCMRHSIRQRQSIGPRCNIDSCKLNQHHPRPPTHVCSLYWICDIHDKAVYRHIRSRLSFSSNDHASNKSRTIWCSIYIYIYIFRTVDSCVFFLLGTFEYTCLFFVFDLKWWQVELIETCLLLNVLLKAIKK